MNSFQFNVIGTIESPYKQKFAIPRQPGLIPEARGKLILTPPYADDDIIRGIETFSHLWLVFVFHQTADKGWSPLVRPPRLGGNTRKGVFATRATFRPNPIGLSVVKLDRVYRKQDKLVLELSGIDLLDGTPILDIKPYLPYADALQDAIGGFADSAPETLMTVSFSEQARDFCQAQTAYPDLALLTEKVLKQDPRPSYKKQRDAAQQYGMTLYQFNIKWTVNGEHNHVTEISQLSEFADRRSQ
ncbi:tRNA (N6-threonylcarbamoyladenosine(37)-N6)-methyltransferase TrmO [Arsukibacterium sp.]|uniref:tRNA (N6-threonylcarbamoyladenosine(37)-N6)-methyltransferase TrmO n=1 Tax=Arsukibacterium sp. TaxID=1977258 RepID=UPI00299EC889|nr:tRNA (N6-threonylcarbamoyladenosine(37)-N6)-methyltransferase TrmO [Arsukibacterium sp.]MDX1676473.1 tRNA (N6-threonylcarbamoyladenosine(37)-N6)-methyltransferase TrmO [Arsukibacterium sp.]